MKTDAYVRHLRGEGEDERQRCIREAAMKLAGILHGGDPNRAANARSEVQTRIARRHGR